MRSTMVDRGLRFSLPFLTNRPLIAERTRLPTPAPRLRLLVLPLAMLGRYPERTSITTAANVTRRTWSRQRFCHSVD